ncbi:phosphopyruvate hydratase [Deinococcus sp.]|uniref:phosphopyruvate hydratase n=1 Tax=Deinococcus sp. TaxID=47478 RepID=UPI003C7E62D1
MNTRIRHLHARQILDSRGRPTVEVDMELEGGARGRGVSPSGASTGKAEAHELRDGDPLVYEGRGVLKAVSSVNGEIAAALRGFDAADQRGLDGRLRGLDGHQSLGRLGANAVLAVSLAACRAAAQARQLPLYRLLAELSGTAQPTLPLPMVNILSGGLHALGGMDVQDFLVLPLSATTFSQALHAVARVRTAAAVVMQGRGLSTLLADEGGLSPGLNSGQEALELLTAAILRAGFRPGPDIGIGLDVAASTFKTEGGYHLAREGLHLDSAGLIEHLSAWVDAFPIVSLEDGLDEEDWPGWKALSERLAGRLQLIGDDLFTTQPQRVQRGIAAGVANSVLVKLNQNGTLSGTLEVIALAKEAGYAPVVSARSGETEDAFIADLAVGTAAGQIKIGSLRTSDRLSKYNQLLRLEEDGLPYAGAAALAERRG